MILNLEFSFFNFHTYIESSVSFSYFSWLNYLIYYYISLNFVLVIPIYATCYFSEDTVTLYVVRPSLSTMTNDITGLNKTWCDESCCG